MINKKSKKADLENKRNTFFLIGLVIALGSVLFAFEWKNEAPKVMEFENTSFTLEEDVFIPSTQPEKKEPPQQLIEAPVFELVKDDALIDDEFIGFDSDVDDESIFDIGTLVSSYVEDKYKKTDVPFILVEEMPEFPGGQKALLNYLSTHVNYPEIAQENGIQGKVYVSFVIDENGNIRNVNILRGVDKSLDSESIRVVQSMPKWKPGKQRGKAVKVQFNVPITFELQ
jgi:protein TonB